MLKTIGKFFRALNNKPGTREDYITLSGEGDVLIFRFTGLAEGLRLFSRL